jgi:hypothetical protein
MGTMKDGKVGFIDGKLVYTKITFEINEYKNKNLEQQQELFKKIEEMIQGFNRDSLISLQGYQTTFDNWAWLQLRA